MDKPLMERALDLRAEGKIRHVHMTVLSAYVSELLYNFDDMFADITQRNIVKRTDINSKDISKFTKDLIDNGLLVEENGMYKLPTMNIWSNELSLSVPTYDGDPIQLLKNQDK